MEINRQNYEQYFIDYLDGNLNPEQVEVLLSFLEFNPDLKEEFTSIGKIFLVPDETTFSGKANLLKSESDLAEATVLKDFDMFCISSLENDIAEEEEEILLGIIRDDPDREDTYMLYQSTRLLPDESILYPGKAKLKKRFINIPYRIILPAAAAVAAILIIIQVFNGKGPDVSLTLTDQVHENSQDDIETKPALTQESQTQADTPLISKGEKSSKTSQVQPPLITGKQPVITNKSITEVESNTSRETVQLARVESKTIPKVSGSNANAEEISQAYLALRQTNNLSENSDSAETTGDNPRLSLWILADASVKGLNSVAEDEYHLDREKDKNGKTRRITFDTPVFGISAPIRKPDKSR